MSRVMSRREFVATSAAGAATALLPQAWGATGRLRAGAAKADITAKVGVSLTGTILQIGPARAIHDKLHARCLVLDDGATRVAIVVADVTMVSGEVLEKAKRLAHERTGIPVNRMMFSATHTHAAPRMIGIGTAPVDKEYYEHFCRQIAEAMAQAVKNLAPASVAWGAADVPRFTRNRRWFMKPGSLGPNPFGDTTDQVMMHGRPAKNRVRPSGPVDPEFSFLFVRHADGRPLAALGNYSIHYVGGYGRATVSADYFGLFGPELAKLLGVDKREAAAFVGLMSNGTSGDIGGPGGSYGGMQRLAHTLASRVAKAWPTLTWHDHVPLVMIERVVHLGVRLPNAERIAWANETLKRKLRKGEHRWTRIYAHETLKLAEYPVKAPVKLQALRVGGLGIAAIPNEVYAITGLAIKRESALKATFTIGLANAYYGYLPTPEQHKLGGYTTWPCRSSCLEVQAEPKIRAAVVNLLKQVAEQGQSD